MSAVAVYTESMRTEWRKALSVLETHPADLTDADIDLLSEQPDYDHRKRAEWRRDCMERRTKARIQQMKTTPTPTRAPLQAKSAASPSSALTGRIVAKAAEGRRVLASWVSKGATPEESASRQQDMADIERLLKAHPERPASRYVVAAHLFDATVRIRELVAFAKSMTTTNRQRDERLSALEAKCAALETKSSGVKWAGAWKSGEAYAEGGLITRQGGLWLATRSAALGTPGDVNSGWQLIVKSGQAPRG